MMTALSPAKLTFSPTSAPRGGAWYRLARTARGLLCVECISDATLHRPGAPASWAFVADVPLYIARQLTDDQSPDQVTSVLERAMHALGCP